MQFNKIGTFTAVAFLLTVASIIFANHLSSDVPVRALPTEAVDLGGLLVILPPDLVEMVEYDPPDTANRRTPRRVVSMGMHVRHPGISQSRTNARDHRTGRPVTVGVNTGSQYPGDQALERWVAAVLSEHETTLDHENYEAVASPIPGLLSYAASGVNRETRESYRQHADAEDVFIHREADGKVSAAISCSNRPIDTAPCRHLMLLSPRAKALVYIQYARPLLGEWQTIQSDVAGLIASFEVKPAQIK